MRIVAIYKIIILFFLFTLTSNVLAKEFIEIEKIINNNEIVYKIYKPDKTKKIKLTNIKIWNEIIERPDKINTIFVNGISDIKLFLLEQGYARLVNVKQASHRYQLAQAEAKTKKKGLWKDSNGIDSMPSPPPVSSSRHRSLINSFYKKVHSILILLFNYVKLLWKWILSLGLLAFLIRFIYKKFYIEKRIKLLIFGEPSVGKTALFLRLVDPKVEPDKILKLSPSRSPEEVTKNNYIPRGKYQIYPKLADIPGSSFSEVWNRFLSSKSHAFILVLSPTRLNQKENLNQIDRKYIDVQLGYLQAYIEGGLGAKATKKPKIIILFLNKFDIFSELPPEDSGSVQKKEFYESLFEEHIVCAKTAAEKAGIPIKVIIGSALKGWNCIRIIDEIANELYGY